MFYETVTKHHFIDAFRQSAERKDQFSYEALEELFQYYDNLGNETVCPMDASNIEFDMIGICCEWSEYDNLKELEEAYDMPLKALEDNTIVIRFFCNNKPSNYYTKPIEGSFLVHEF